MSRTPILAGNWKMHYTVAESVAFVKELEPAIAGYDAVERVVCPTFVALASVAEALRGSAVKVGAQDVHWEAKGAYTSEIAAGMLVGLADYAIIGHSECRKYLGDTDERVNLKIKAALGAGLKPIFAVGETKDEYEAKHTADVVTRQVTVGLGGVSAEQMASLVIAYEPVWAIGTGLNADSQYANTTIGLIRQTVRGLYGDGVADALRIQYGGSVKPDNMAEYMAQPEIDGALVGGASLKVPDFLALVAAAAQVKG
ncbi:MAG: triose-phosphate isomerase [Anaerolineae bacterium]|nr:triose-phosphate isomerase [Anaerolineae bacterium]